MTRGHKFLAGQRRGVACLACAALCIMYLFVRGIICMEWHENYMLDVWRDLTMVHPGASVLNPVPTGGPTPNPKEFEDPLDGTQHTVMRTAHA